MSANKRLGYCTVHSGLYYLLDCGQIRVGHWAWHGPICMPVEPLDQLTNIAALWLQQEQQQQQPRVKSKSEAKA